MTKEVGPLAEFSYYNPQSERNKGVRVAVVDDSIAESLAEFFSKIGGYEVMGVQVDTGVHAGPLATEQLINKIVAWGPDWVISDVGLGNVDGTEIIKGCKKEGIKTIMFTGMATSRIRIAEVNGVADFYVAKPVMPDRLLEIIDAG